MADRVRRTKPKPLRGKRRVLNAVGWTISIAMVTAVVGVLLDAVILTAVVVAWAVLTFLVNRSMGPNWWRKSTPPDADAQAAAKDASRRKGHRDVKG